MESSQKKGYVAGLSSLLLAVIFGIMVSNIGLESSGGQLMLAFSLIFGGLGVFSFIKPDSIEIITWEFIQRIGNENESAQPNQEVNIHGDNFGNAGNTANESNTEQSTIVTDNNPDE